MLKHLTTFLLIIACLSPAFAQDSLSISRDRQVGLNVTGILSQTPILPSDGQSAGLYSLIFKRPSKRKVGKLFRFSVAGKVGIGNFSNSGFTLGIGNEKEFVTEGRWHLNFGNEVLLFFENSAFSAGIGVGYGPLASIRFDINDRLSLMTEGSAYLTLSAGPSSGLTFNLRPPSGLVLVFKY